jgi:hypothetical protein
VAVAIAKTPISFAEVLTEGNSLSSFICYC